MTHSNRLAWREPPGYASRFLGRTCRLAEPLLFHGDDAAPVLVPAGAPVFVYRGEYLDEPREADDGYRFVVALLRRSGREDPRGLSRAGVAADQLEPEPGVIDWAREDSRAALAQGWDVFFCGGSSGPLWQLCKVDEDGRFRDDNAAWSFVWEQAVENNDPLAQRALAFLYYRSPREYRAVRKHLAEPED